jgi:hypothetical protein
MPHGAGSASPVSGSSRRWRLPGRFHDHHFQRRPHARLEQVPSVRGAVGLAHHDVGVELGMAVRSLGEISHQGEDLNLLRQVNPPAPLPFRVPIPQRHLLQRTDG